MNKLFKALNDPTRREILDLLRAGDMTVNEIASHFEISLPSISHHLDKLKQADLVSTIKKGQFIHYSINMTVIEDLLEYVMNLKSNKNE